jgi:hypothetical protein
MNDDGRANCCRGFAAVLLVSCIVLHGCSASSTPIRVDTPLDATHEKLMKIGMAYSRFSMSHKRPPQAWSDLQPILAEMENADEPWRSARDGQPLVVCWGVDLSQSRTWAKTTPVLAYEKQGTDGSRYILTAVRSVELLSDKDFHEASFPPGHDPGA